MLVRWTEPAARDLIQICDYIERRGGGDIARRVALSIHQRIGSLAEFPAIGRLGRKRGTRELVLADLPYLAVYRVGESSIEILRILHGAQKWP